MTSSHQPRRYRLVDHHGQPHLELDEQFDSIEEAWAFATHWWQQQQPAGQPACQIGLGLEVSTESGSWRTLRHPPARLNLCNGEPTGHDRPGTPVLH